MRNKQPPLDLRSPFQSENILRRSLNSINLWVERFAILSDPRIARAFSDMAAHPGDNHTVEKLAEAACLSRSAFMSRFSKLVGNSPMIVLRDLRMRQAAQQLRAGNHAVEKIASLAGYAGRSSFVRAFKEVYDVDPTEYRAKHNSVLFTELFLSSADSPNDHRATAPGHSRDRAHSLH